MLLGSRSCLFPSVLRHMKNQGNNLQRDPFRDVRTGGQQLGNCPRGSIEWNLFQKAGLDDKSVWWWCYLEGEEEREGDGCSACAAASEPGCLEVFWIVSGTESCLKFSTSISSKNTRHYNVVV